MLKAYYDDELLLEVHTPVFCPSYIWRDILSLDYLATRYLCLNNDRFEFDPDKIRIEQYFKVKE